MAAAKIEKEKEADAFTAAAEFGSTVRRTTLKGGEYGKNNLTVWGSTRLLYLRVYFGRDLQKMGQQHV